METAAGVHPHHRRIHHLHRIRHLHLQVQVHHPRPTAGVAGVSAAAELREAGNNDGGRINAPVPYTGSPAGRRFIPSCAGVLK